MYIRLPASCVSNIKIAVSLADSHLFNQEFQIQPNPSNKTYPSRSSTAVSLLIVAKASKHTIITWEDEIYSHAYTILFLFFEDPLIYFSLHPLPQHHKQTSCLDECHSLQETKSMIKTTIWFQIGCI